MKATILIDNIADTGFISEWGFSVWIEHRGKNYLLDTGSSDNYLLNAKLMGIDVADADFSVLSHAHYDHSGGYDSFFEKNKKAKLYVSAGCGENCYFKLGPIRKYIGLPKELLNRHSERIEAVDGFCTLSEGVWLVPHIENGLGAIGKKAHMVRRENGRSIPDDFRHEQSLVFDTENGLVVFNSCSHGGLQNILADIEHYLPGKSVYMTVGGLHFKGSSRQDILGVAETIKSLDIGQVITGHCTGDKGFAILKSELGDKVVQTNVGMVIEV